VAEERTIVILKPDALLRGLVGRILEMFETKGFKVVGMKMVHLSDEQLYGLYPSLPQKPFHDQVRRIMLAAPCICLVLEGHEAVRAAYQLAGPYRNPEEDSGWSVRGRFALWTGSDLIHRADDLEIARSQISMFFEPHELATYHRFDECLMGLNAWNELAEDALPVARDRRADDSAVSMVQQG
jgi:nucleoside-diphosphate kinase